MRVRAGADVTLSVGERVRVNVAQTVGDVRESVTISSDASLLRTEIGSLLYFIDFLCLCANTLRREKYWIHTSRI